MLERAKIRASLGVSENDVLLLSVGELSKRKSHEVVIRVIVSIPDVFYLIAGQGDLRAELQRLIDSLGLKSRVFLLGFRKDVSELYDAADIFLFPSLREGLGLAAIEAMASGLPIITSNVHGINDYSIDGETGFTKAPNDVQGFAEAIRVLSEDEGLRKRMGIRAGKNIEKYDISSALAYHKQLYLTF